MISFNSFCFAYSVGFPLTITLLVTRLVFISSGVFTIDMTLYGEYYLELALFMGWIMIISLKGFEFLNQIISFHYKHLHLK